MTAETIPAETTAEGLRAVLTAAAAAAPAAAVATPTERSGWLDAVASAIEASAEDLAAVADTETGLGRARLDGEVQRCANQLRFYAAVGVEGSWLGATIDHATDTAPDVRRVNLPIGPVAVFGASNFPFAFGTLGNDTGAALASGNPVVVKGHPAHPRTHTLLLDIATDALASAGAPEGLLTAVTGMDAARALILAPEITAVGFTGSEAGGMALRELANSREHPIPVYAEMGTVNAVVVTEAAVARTEEIAIAALGSFTLGLGQFCTKPGLVLAPAGSGFGAALARELTAAPPGGVLLTAGIHQAFHAGIGELLAAGAVPLAHPEPIHPLGPQVWVVQADPGLLVPGSRLLRECFGPVIVVAEYADVAQRDSLIASLPGALAASVITGGPDDPDVAGLVGALTPKVGRVIVDGWPTGVATTWAQHHGGPWPATTIPSATSVGAAGLDRFTRPVAYQSVPQAALPVPLREDNPWRIVRRMDGRLEIPGTS